VLIKFNDQITPQILTQFELEFKKSTKARISFSTALATSSSAKGASGPTTQDKIASIMNKGFNTIIALTMFLCFFALSANMSANLIQQTKEVAVLRSIGFTKWRIRMLYFYEAMILVLASCTLGILVGMVVGYTMSLQESLILGLSLGVFFPW
jgi:ABC-type antimicrobial peptide transport system permease subunit